MRHIHLFYSYVCTLLFLMIYACGCGPTQEEIMTPKTIKKIEAQYLKEGGVPIQFVKVHNLSGSEGDYILEAVIKKGDKKYLANLILIKFVEKKTIVTLPPFMGQEL